MREERKGLHDERESQQNEDEWYVRDGVKERGEGGERERDIFLRLPASQSASPGQHRPGIVASALASLLSRTINLASIPDRPFSVSPFMLMCACYLCSVYVRTCNARAYVCATDTRYPVRLARGESSPARERGVRRVPRRPIVRHGGSNRWTSRFLVFADSHFLHDQWSSKYVKANARYHRNDCFLGAAFSTLIILSYYVFVADLSLAKKISITSTSCILVIGIQIFNKANSLI